MGFPPGFVCFRVQFVPLFFPTSRRPTSQGGLGGGQRALRPGGSDALEGRHPGITNDDR
jgi:hypothetical protein